MRIYIACIQCRTCLYNNSGECRRLLLYCNFSGIAGFLLNIVIVAFIAKKWKKLEPVELLIGNMALANMTFVLCYGMVIQTTLQHQWVYGNTGKDFSLYCFLGLSVSTNFYHATFLWWTRSVSIKKTVHLTLFQFII